MSLGVGLAWDDVLWDLPSAVVGVCYLNSQPILGFKAVDKTATDQLKLLC